MQNRYENQNICGIQDRSLRVGNKNNVAFGNFKQRMSFTQWVILRYLVEQDKRWDHGIWQVSLLITRLKWRELNIYIFERIWKFIYQSGHFQGRCRDAWSYKKLLLFYWHYCSLQVKDFFVIGGTLRQWVTHNVENIEIKSKNKHE